MSSTTGAGIALLVVGAVLSFAVKDSISGVNLALIGYICMGAGALALILAIAMNSQRNNTTHREVVEQRTTPQAPPAQQAPVAQAAPQAPVAQAAPQAPPAQQVPPAPPAV